MADPIQVLIVDCDVMCRDLFQHALEGLPDITVVGVSPNGKLGLHRTRQLNVDLVILDASLTDLSAEEFTRTALAELPQLGILVSSSNAASVADRAILALEAGAFDFILKPQVKCRQDAVAALRRTLLPKIRSFSILRYSRIAKNLSLASRDGTPDAPVIAAAPPPVADARSRIERKVERRQIEAVLIGASTGGPEALAHLLPSLPSSLPVPVVIVLHMPKLFTSRLAAALDQRSALTVTEAQDGDTIARGTVYLAPGGQHLFMERGTRRRIMLRTDDGPPENGCKPSVDVLFRSAAQVFGGRVLAVILTGMGADGTKGLQALKECDAPVLAQDEDSSVVWGMPGSAAQAGCVDEVLALDAIAGRIAEIVV